MFRNVFISYARKDQSLVNILINELKTQHRESWVDWKDIPKSVDWQREIWEGIEKADSFIFIASHDSIKSTICLAELNYALNLNKRIIPIIVKGIEIEQLPNEIRIINSFRINEDTSLESIVPELIDTIDKDFEWIREHTKLTVKASEWLRSNKHRSFLIRGKNLKYTEEWIIKKEVSEPKPSNLILEFIQCSQKNARNLKRILTGVSVLILAGISYLSFLYLIEIIKHEETTYDLQNEKVLKETAESIAEQEKEVSISNKIAAESLFRLDNDFDLALLLSVESYQLHESYQSLNALFSAWQSHPSLMKYVIPKFDTWTSIAISTNGERYAVSKPDGTIQIHNLENHELLKQLRDSHTEIIDYLLFSPNDEILFSSSLDGKMILWDLSTLGETLLTTESDSTWSVAFSPDGNHLAVGGIFNLLLFETKTGKVKHELNNTGAYSVAFSPDSKLLAAGEDNHIFLYDINTGEQISSFTPDSQLDNLREVMSVSFHPTKDFIASGSVDNSVRIWSINLQTQYGETLRGHSGQVNSVKFSPYGNVLASGGVDNQIFLYDISNIYFDWDLIHLHKGSETPLPSILYPQIRSPLKGNTSSIQDIIFTNDEKSILSISSDSIIQWYAPQWLRAYPRELFSDLSTGYTLVFNNIYSHYPVGDIKSLSFNDEGETLYSSSTKVLAFWDLYSRTIDYDAFPFIETLEVFIRDSKVGYSALGFENGDVAVIENSNEGIENGPFVEFQTGNIRSMDLNNDGSVLAVSFCDSVAPISCTCCSIEFYNTSNGNKVGETLEGYECEIRTITYSPVEDIFAAGGKNLIRLWSIVNGEFIEKFSIEVSGQVESLAFHPTENILASAVRGKIFLWDTQTGNQIGLPLEADRYKTSCIDFSPNGKLLASGGWDETISIWDVESGQRIGLPLSGHTEIIGVVKFSTDGSYFASGDDKGIIRIWNIDPDNWIKQNCIRAGRHFTKDEWKHFFGNKSYNDSCPNSEINNNLDSEYLTETRSYLSDGEDPINISNTKTPVSTKTFTISPLLRTPEILFTLDLGLCPLKANHINTPENEGCVAIQSLEIDVLNKDGTEITYDYDGDSSRIGYCAYYGINGELVNFQLDFDQTGTLFCQPN